MINEFNFIHRVYMVYEDEWSAIKNLFVIDKEICVKRNRGSFVSSNTSHSHSGSMNMANGIQNELLSSEPKVCLNCVEKKRYLPPVFINMLRHTFLLISLF